MSKKEQYSQLQTQLEAQSSLCHTIAAHYLKSGNKNQATHYLRYKNSFNADLNSLISYSNHDKDVPVFHYQEVSYEIENFFPELAANDMEICIERAWNLGNKEVNGKDVVAYVSWNVAWPPEGSPGAGSGKGDTSTASDRGMNPEFNFKKRIDIVRSKPFQRYLERKKATFEVFHYKGFLRKSISLGKANIKLDTLLRKSEIHEVLELVDHVRKPTGGKLEIRIRLRTPCLQPEIMTKTEKWLIIDEFNKDFTNLISSPISTTSSSPAKSKSSKQNIKLSSPSPAAATVATTATAATVNTTPFNPASGVSSKSQSETKDLSITTTTNTTSSPISIDSYSVTIPPEAPTTLSSPPPASVTSPSKTKEQNVFTSNTETIDNNEVISNTEHIKIEKNEAITNTTANNPTTITTNIRDATTITDVDLQQKVTTAEKQTPSATPQKSNHVAQTSDTGKDELEQAEEQLNSVENIASNLVLQSEIEFVTKQITTLEALKKPIPEDLLDRQNELEIKMNLLLISVQTNELTITEYIEKVKASIVNYKKLALVFKKAGKLDEAKKALGRSKIMEGEVKEVEEAIKSGMAMG